MHIALRVVIKDPDKESEARDRLEAGQRGWYICVPSVVDNATSQRGRLIARRWSHVGSHKSTNTNVWFVSMFVATHG